MPECGLARFYFVAHFVEHFVVFLFAAISTEGGGQARLDEVDRGG